MTLVRSVYRLNPNAAKRAVGDVEFLSYSINPTRNARISVDGRAKVTANFYASTYTAEIEPKEGVFVIIKGATGKPRRFRSEQAAMKGALKELERWKP